MQSVQVSEEMIALIGAGSIGSSDWPADSVALVYGFGGVGFSAAFRFHEAPDRDALDADAGQTRLILIVARAACQRIFRLMPREAGTAWHMPADLRAIALALRDCDLPEPARDTYRLAKSIELLCETFALLGRPADLVPVAPEGQLSRGDSQRIIAARRLIDERWSEKLTLDTIARACGLNRAKLTRGFRDMFACSIADALAEQRLCQAQQLLLATDLPISSIGYKCGYLNNASFTRAFARRFGTAPTQYRAHRLAA